VVLLPRREHDNPPRSSSLFRVFIIILYLDGACSLQYFGQKDSTDFYFIYNYSYMVWLTVGPGFDSRLSTLSIRDEDYTQGSSAQYRGQILSSSLWECSRRRCYRVVVPSRQSTCYSRQHPPVLSQGQKMIID
jgi:hypothetical protein